MRQSVVTVNNIFGNPEQTLIIVALILISMLIVSQIIKKGVK